MNTAVYIRVIKGRVFLGQLSDCHLVKEDSGCDMAQAVSHRPFTAVARVRPKANPCGIYGGKSDTARISYVTASGS